MRELTDIVKAWKAATPGRRMVLATVVEVSGSTYRRPGARMLMSEGEWLAGTVSGGCLEADLLATAWERTETGPALVTYDATSSDDVLWGFGLGCNGLVKVLVERLEGQEAYLLFLAERLDTRKAGVMSTVISEGPNLGKHSFDVLDSGGEKTGKSNIVLVETIQPPRELVIFGAGADAAPLVNIAAEIGYRISVVDHRESYVEASRFPQAEVVLCPGYQAFGDIHLGTNCAAVVMTHNYLHDKRILKSLLKSNVAYVGLLGPKLRADRILAELRDEGIVRKTDGPELRAPVGLDLGADGPHEIALSILSEIQAFFHHAQAAPLKDIDGPIHAVSERSTCPSR